MIDILPYQLTKGVIATRDGLDMSNAAKWMMEPLAPNMCGSHRYSWTIPWPDVSKVLYYQEGKPITWTTNTMELTVNYSSWTPNHAHGIALDRISAMLTRDAEAFRVLHWCVTELGGEEG